MFRNGLSKVLRAPELEHGMRGKREREKKSQSDTIIYLKFGFEAARTKFQNFEFLQDGQTPRSHHQRKRGRSHRTARGRRHRRNCSLQNHASFFNLSDASQSAEHGGYNVEWIISGIQSGQSGPQPCPLVPNPLESVVLGYRVDKWHSSRTT